MRSRVSEKPAVVMGHLLRECSITPGASRSYCLTRRDRNAYENNATLVTDLRAKMREFCLRPEIENFDLSHLYGAKRLVEAGQIEDHPHVQFVLGVQNAMSAVEHLIHDAVRTELEDNIRISKDQLAASNAEIVRRAAETIERWGRRVATLAEARSVLGLAPATASARGLIRAVP